MNKTLRKAMLSTICMLVVAVVSLTGVTYAWFSQGTDAKVNGLEVKVEAADGGIMIAGADGYSSADDLPEAADYSNTLNLETTFGGTKGVSPVSTVGSKTAFNFFTANLVTPTEITTAADATPSNNVYKYYLFLRNENSGGDMTINLGGNVVDGKTQSNPTSITTNGSASGIANAARLGLRYVDTQAVPQKTLSKNGSVNSDTGFGIFSNLGTEYIGVNAASEAKFNKDTITSGVNDSKLASVDPLTPTEWSILVPDNSIVVVELLVWVEGQDSACINANAGTNFVVSLVFDKVPAQAEVTD